MPRTTRTIGTFALFVFLLTLTGCGERVWVKIPADLELDGYDRIGLVRFTGAEPQLEELATHQFQQSVLAAQPGVRLLDLGDERRLLGAIDRYEMDNESIRRIAAENGLDAIFVGELQLSEIAPKFDLSTAVANVRTSVDVQASLNVRLVEAASGATIWMNSRNGKISIAHAAVDENGVGSFGFGDRDAKTKQLVSSLATDLTHDFRADFVRRSLEDVPPNYVSTYPDGRQVFVPPTTSRYSQVNP